MDASSNFFSRVGLAISMYASNKASDVMEEGGGSPVRESELSFSPIRNSELYPHNHKVVDKGCSATVQPFPSLSGEALEYIGLLGEDCYIAISNYRFFVSNDNGFYNVPLGLIDAVELYGSKEQIVILCKDGGRFCVLFESQASCHMWLERLRQVTRGAKDLEKTFAFVHWAYSKDQQQQQQQTTVAITEHTHTYNNNNGSVITPVNSLRDHQNSWNSVQSYYSSEMVRAEFHRMNMHTSGTWRITDCNSEYKICSTYPKLLVVPFSMTEEEIRLAARFRTMGRLPTVVWRHSGNGAVIARSSQPLVGVLGWRNGEDEKLLQAISQSCTPISSSQRQHGESSNPVSIPYRNGGPSAQMMGDRSQMKQSVLISNGHSNGISSPQQSHAEETLQDGAQLCPELQDKNNTCPELLVMDLRSYTAALGNRAKGGGCECTDYYPNCEVVYKNLPNIHSVRKSFQQLRNILHHDDQSNFLSNLESTQWLHYLCQLVSVACDVVKTVDEGGKPVLVHCSDGWDRTAQVVPLAELMLDPYYRTIEGFQVLIEREWLGFGHRFSDRCGQHAACSDTNQRCPVFLQWLDCVHQLVLQFPCHFQFNLNFLVKLGLHSYSCLYGTLLGNSMQERDSVRITKRTHSLWSLLNIHNSDVVNPLFTSSGPPVLHPVAHLHKMQLWHAMFTATSLTPSSVLTDHQHHTFIRERDNTNTTNTGKDLTQEVKLKDDDDGSESLGIAVSSPATMEMREFVSCDKHHSTSRHRHSDSSFASLSGSFSPSPTLPSGDGGSHFNPSGNTDGGHQLEQHVVKKVGEGDKESINGRLSPSEPRTLPEISTTSTDTIAITTDSTHNNDDTPVNRSSPKSHAAMSGTVSTTVTSTGYNMSTDLLHDAMHDQSPHQYSYMNGSVRHNGHETRVQRIGQNFEVGVISESYISGGCWGCVKLDADGMSSRNNEVDRRLTCILQSYEIRINSLKQELMEVKTALSACVKEKDRRGESVRWRESRGVDEKDGEEEATTAGASIIDDNQSPSSLASWDCLDGGEGVGVKWVPDHAATHCQDCGAAFSLIIRKHHCRACGGVFCSSCTDYMCPVPDEHLYTDVRVCLRCYNRLDGHLLTDNRGPT